MSPEFIQEILVFTTSPSNKKLSSQANLAVISTENTILQVFNQVFLSIFFFR